MSQQAEVLAVTKLHSLAVTNWHSESSAAPLLYACLLHAAPLHHVCRLALTPSSPSNGCLRFWPGSHKEQLPHKDTYAPDNMLLKGQAIMELEQRQEQGMHIDLRPGQASLHHIRAAHASGPAAAGALRRVGIAFRYMSAHVRQGLHPRDSGEHGSCRWQAQLLLRLRPRAAEQLKPGKPAREMLFISFPMTCSHRCQWSRHLWLVPPRAAPIPGHGHSRAGGASTARWPRVPRWLGEVAISLLKVK